MIDLAASGVWWNARRGGGARAREGVGVMRARGGGDAVGARATTVMCLLRRRRAAVGWRVGGRDETRLRD